MDPKFADRMTDLAQLTPEVLDQRWETLTGLANEADRHQQARLVLIACGAGMERDEDAWFWQPFREHETTLPVEDGQELFMRFAECAARHMIQEKRQVLPAMCVRLADLVGLLPFHQDLVDAAAELLEERPPTAPSFAPPSSFWTSANREALQENPADPTVVGEQFAAMAAGVQKAVTALTKQVGTLTRWAAETEVRVDHEQRLTQWLLNGARGDGQPWGDLDAASVAVDAAVEVAQFVLEAPQARHEDALAQVLAVAGKGSASVAGVVDDLAATFSVPDDPALAALVPLTVALAAGEPLPELTSAELTLRVLWETTTIDVWEA